MINPVQDKIVGAQEKAMAVQAQANPSQMSYNDSGWIKPKVAAKGSQVKIQRVEVQDSYFSPLVQKSAGGEPSPLLSYDNSFMEYQRP